MLETSVDIALSRSKQDEVAKKKRIDLNPLYDKEQYTYPQRLIVRFNRRFQLLYNIIFGIAFLLATLFFGVAFYIGGVLTGLASILIILSIAVFGLAVMVLPPGKSKQAKTNVMQLNDIVVHDDLTVSRAYNYIDMARSSYHRVLVHLPENSYFLEDFIDTQLGKHGLYMSDSKYIRDDLIESCQYQAYDYSTLKQILDTKFKIKQYENEKYILSKRQQEKERTQLFRRQVTNRNKLVNRNNAPLLQQLNKDKQRINSDQKAHIKHLNQKIDDNKKIIKDFIEK